MSESARIGTRGMRGVRYAALVVATLALAIGTVMVAGFAGHRAGAANRVPASLVPGEIYSMSATGITGEGTLGTGSIEVDSFTWGVTRGASGHTKPKVADFVVQRQLDRDSPTFFTHCYAGEPLTSVDLYVQPGGDGGDFLTIKLSNVVITSVQWAAGAQDQPTEQLTMTASRFQIVYARNSG